MHSRLVRAIALVLFVLCTQGSALAGVLADIAHCGEHAGAGHEARGAPETPLPLDAAAECCHSALCMFCPGGGTVVSAHVPDLRDAALGLAPGAATPLPRRHFPPFRPPR